MFSPSAAVAASRQSSTGPEAWYRPARWRGIRANRSELAGVPSCGLRRALLREWFLRRLALFVRSTRTPEAHDAIRDNDIVARDAPPSLVAELFHEHGTDRAIIR